VLNLVAKFRYCALTSMDGGRSLHAYKSSWQTSKSPPLKHCDTCCKSNYRRKEQSKQQSNERSSAI
jgi:hypothetical protein